MAVDQSKLRLNKRKIRIERCKNRPSGINQSTPRTTDGERASKRGNKPQPTAHKKERTFQHNVADIPKGDPTLGDRLRGLDKNARHAAKAADPFRQARRLAKKKARHALESAVLRTDKNKSAGSVLGKMKAPGKPKVKAKVSRVRSAKSAATRNTKK